MQDGYERNLNLQAAGFTAGPCLLKDTMQLSSFYKNKFTLGYTAMKINENMKIKCSSQQISYSLCEERN